MDLEKLADELAAILYDKKFGELTAEERRALYERVAEVAEEINKR